MFGRFVSEEIFEKKKKKPCIESEAKHMKLGRKKKKDQCYLYLGTRVLRSVLGYPSK